MPAQWCLKNMMASLELGHVLGPWLLGIGHAQSALSGTGHDCEPRVPNDLLEQQQHHARGRLLDPLQHNADFSWL